MKKSTLLALLFSLVFILVGCSQDSVSCKEDTYSISQIINSAKESGYPVENTTEIDGGYKAGDECVSIQIPFEDGSTIFCFISYYKSDKQLEGIINELKNSDLYTYIKKGNTIAIYSKNYNNLDSILNNIMSCKADSYGSAFVDSK